MSLTTDERVTVLEEKVAHQRELMDLKDQTQKEAISELKLSVASLRKAIWSFLILSAGSMLSVIFMAMWKRLGF